ncbi:hypothetical protein ACEWA7_20005 [Vibrio parahaemolyticus]
MKSIWSCDDSLLDEVVKSGSLAILPMVSAPIESGVDVPFKDITVALPVDAKVQSVLEMLEEKALEYVQSYGVNDIRQYFIEEVTILDDSVVFNWGS